MKREREIFFLSIMVIACVTCRSAGLEPSAERPSPVPPEASPAPSGTDPVELCAGVAHTCVRLRDGQVACWGDNFRYQSADDERATIAAPTLVGFLPAVALYCGAYETCVTRADGAIHCIGGRTRGIEQLDLASPAIDVVLHDDGGCVLQRDGRALCWRSDDGRPRSERLEEVASGAIGLALHPEERRVCAQRSSEAPLCFRPEMPADVVTLPASSLLVDDGGRSRVSGFDHTCEIFQETIRCRGAASQGQLGSGRSYQRSSPTEVPGIDDAVALDAGPTHACVTRRSGGVLCWGRWARRQRPEGARSVKLAEPHFRPQDMAAPDAVIDVRVGPSDSTCVRTAEGWRCLYDSWQRDDGLAGARPGWLERLHAPPLRHLAKDGSCGVTRAGRLICAAGLVLASNRASMTSLATFEHSEPFVEASSAFCIDCRDFHRYVCGRTDSGRVRCFRIPGGHPPAPVDSPTIEALTDVAQLSAGPGLVCALTSQGRVDCWGDNRFDQLGTRALSDGADAFTAVRIHGLPPVVEIASGGSYACARTAAGRVWCWGSNREGTAPDGSSGRSAEPVPVVWPPERRPPAHPGE